MIIKLATDCMGGDHGVGVTIPATTHFLATHEDVEVLLVGQPDVVAAQLKRLYATASPRVHVVPASEVASMDDPVEVALCKKRNSSVRVAINQLKESAVQACAPAGNTGALMAMSRYILKTLDGIDRPAIAMAIPNGKGAGTTVLDLSANADCKPKRLLQFTQMASAVVSVIEQKPRPTVGLLNIGEEVIKGNEVVKQAGELLCASNPNFFGNVEGNDIFKGTTDIVVCNGFIGNVALGSAEGLARMIGEVLHQEFNHSWFTRLLAVVALLVLARFKRHVDHRRYNGAAPLGLRGLVIRSHGSADAYVFEWAIKRAYDTTASGVIAHIAQAFGSHHDVAGAAPVPTSIPAADAA